MKRRHIIFVIFIIITVMFQGCENFLMEEPKGFAAPELVLNSETGITQTLYGVYAPYTEYFWRERYPALYSMAGDDIFPGEDTDVGRREVENFTFTASNSAFGLSWAGGTRGISRANLLIEGLNKYEKGAFKDRIMAEAKFLRAFYYFWQVRTFGPVPLLTEYENSELYPSNSTIKEIYDQIIEDLKVAESLPGWKELQSEKGRATRGAAKALLGKVYLTMATTEETKDNQYFTLAASKLKEVIDDGYGLIEDGYVNAFWPANEGSIEDIWSCQFVYGAPSGKQGYIHAQFAPNPDPHNQRAFGRLVIMPYLYEMFENQDLRRQAMLKGEYEVNTYNSSGIITNTTTCTTPSNYPYTIKFTDPTWSKFTHNDSDTNFPIIRFSDVLLMYSEAINESQGPVDQAYYGIDLVRKRANASELQRGMTQEVLRQKIREERLLELHGEGHSWFDLVRWGTLETRIKEVNPNAQVSWPKHRFFPIPQTEINANSNLKQNDGY